MTVPNFHLRGIPPELYDGLRKRSEANGRSINAEILALVEEALEEDADQAGLLDELRAFRRKRLRKSVPPPEQLIREARDERARRP